MDAERCIHYRTVTQALRPFADLGCPPPALGIVVPDGPGWSDTEITDCELTGNFDPFSHAPSNSNPRTLYFSNVL